MDNKNLYRINIILNRQVKNYATYITTASLLSQEEENPTATMKEIKTETNKIQRALSESYKLEEYGRNI